MPKKIFEPRAYQELAVKKIIEEQKIILMMEMGMG